MQSCPTSTPGHAVVLCDHQIDILTDAEDTIHLTLGIFQVPRSINTSQQGNALQRINHMVQPLGTFHCRRRASQPSNLKQAQRALLERTHIVPHGLANLHIVGPHESGILITLYLPVDNHHGNTYVKSLLDCWRYGMCLVGADNQEVHPFVDEIGDIGNLLPVVVAHRAHLEPYALVERCLALHLFVLLRAPFILTAL